MGVHKYVVPIDLTLFGVPNYSNAIFVTPSVNYASCFGIEEIQKTDNICRIVILQVRVKPNSYTIHPNTTNYDFADSHFNNDQLEWRIANPRDVFPYRILIKTVSLNEISQLFRRR